MEDPSLLPEFFLVRPVVPRTPAVVPLKSRRWKYRSIAIVPPGALSHSTAAVMIFYFLDSRVSPLVSGFAALAAAVEAVVPLASGSTAPTTAASTALGPDLAPPLVALCLHGSTAWGSGSTTTPSSSTATPSGITALCGLNGG